MKLTKNEVTIEFISETILNDTQFIIFKVPNLDYMQPLSMPLTTAKYSFNLDEKKDVLEFSESILNYYIERLSSMNAFNNLIGDNKKTNKG